MRVRICSLKCLKETKGSKGLTAWEDLEDNVYLARSFTYLEQSFC